MIGVEYLVLGRRVGYEKGFLFMISPGIDRIAVAGFPAPQITIAAAFRLTIASVEPLTISYDLDIVTHSGTSLAPSGPQVSQTIQMKPLSYARVERPAHVPVTANLCANYPRAGDYFVVLYVDGVERARTMLVVEQGLHPGTPQGLMM